MSKADDISVSVKCVDVWMGMCIGRHVLVSDLHNAATLITSVNEVFVGIDGVDHSGVTEPHLPPDWTQLTRRAARLDRRH